MKCIDVSEFQGDINWEKVKNDGIECVVIRAGYGKGNPDGKFTANITGAIKAGLNIGIYWFSYAYTVEMAKKEADYVHELIQPYRININMPVFFDWEYDSMNYANKNDVNPDAYLITEMTKAFCERIEELGYYGGYYLNQDYAKNYYNEDDLTNYKRWFAKWVKTKQKDCYLWQNSEEGSVDGIKGNVDTDILNGELLPFDIKPEKEDSVEEAPIEPEVKPETVPAPQTMESDSNLGYTIGEVYTVNVRSALNVRTGAGTIYPLVGYANLTSDGKLHAYSSGALKNGTRVTCLEVKKISDKEIWIKIPSGWICAVSGDKRYVV